MKTQEEIYWDLWFFISLWHITFVISGILSDHYCFWNMANKRLIDRRRKRVFKYQTTIDHIVCLYIFQGHTSYKNSALEKLNELWQQKKMF